MGKSSGSDRSSKRKKYSSPADYQKKVSEYNSLKNRYTNFAETQRKMQLEIYFLEEKIKEYRSMSLNLSALNKSLSAKKRDLKKYKADIAAIK